VSILRPAALLCCLVLPGFPLQAQNTTDSSALPPYQVYYDHLFDGMFSFLTAAERTEFEKALYPALDKNPDLASEGLKLLQAGGKPMTNPPDADALAYERWMRDYEARLREASLAGDPAAALATIDEAITACRHHGEFYFLSPLYRKRAQILSRMPGCDPAEVAAALAEAIAIAEAQGAAGFAKAAVLARQRLEADLLTPSAPLARR